MRSRAANLSSHQREKRAQGPLPCSSLGLEQARREHRREGERDDQRAQRGGGDGEAELFEEGADLAADQARRREDHHVHQGDRQRRQPDLGATVDGRGLRRFATRQVPQRVLQDDDRVVDQDADRQNERQRADEVQAEAQHAHDRERGQQRGRNRQQHDQRHARAVQEQQQDDRGQDDGRHQLFEHAVDRGADEGAVVLNRDQLRARRQLGLQLWEQAVDAVGDVGGVGAGLRAEAEQHAVVPVDAGDLGLLLAGQLHGGDVAHADRRLGGAADRDAAQVLRLDRQVRDAQVVRVGVLGQAAGWDGRVARGQGGLQRSQRQAVARQLVRIDQDLDLLLLAADDAATWDTPVTCCSCGLSVSFASEYRSVLLSVSLTSATCMMGSAFGSTFEVIGVIA